MDYTRDMSPVPQPPPPAPPVRPASAADAVWIRDVLCERWGATTIVVHGEVIDAARLPALIAETQRGLATFQRLGGDAELVTLDAIPAGIGTGTALIEALARELRAEGRARLWLTMTNGNLSALRFYLRRGFRLHQVRPGAVDAARRLKSSIPSVGEHGIPIHDELDLCRVLDPAAQDVPALPPWREPWPQPLAAARQSYAEELRFTAPIRSAAVVKAFATVPRERFLGPGPWRILSAVSLSEYWTTENADPRHVYHDVLVAIDQTRRLNNGQPSLWAYLYDQLGPDAGVACRARRRRHRLLQRRSGRDRRSRWTGDCDRDRPCSRRPSAGKSCVSLAAGGGGRGGRFHLPSRPAGRCRHRQCRGHTFFARLARLAGGGERPAAGAADQCTKLGWFSAGHAACRRHPTLSAPVRSPGRDHPLSRGSQSRGGGPPQGGDGQGPHDRRPVFASGA